MIGQHQEPFAETVISSTLFGNRLHHLSEMLFQEAFYTTLIAPFLARLQVLYRYLFPQYYSSSITFRKCSFMKLF